MSQPQKTKQTGFILLNRLNRAFTLLELLIVIAILAVLAVIVIVVINPAEAMRKTRDTQRMTELSSLSEAVSFLQTESQGTLDLDGPSVNTCKAQANQTIYLSLVDNASAVCNTLIAAGDLPAAPAGWQYSCITAANLYNVDGTGWIPIDFNSVPGVGSPISNLPADPVNNASQGLYYQYICDATNSVFEIDPILESQAYKRGGDKDAVSTDGGDNFNLYESGTDLTSSPISDSGLVGYWQLEENIGTSASDSSGQDNTGTIHDNEGDQWVSGEIGYALEFDGNNDYVDCGSSNNLTGNNLQTITVSAWIKTNTTATQYIVSINRSAAVSTLITLTSNQNSSGSNASGYLGFLTRNNADTTHRWLVHSNNYNDNKWHHVVAVINNLTRILYIDGEQRGTDNEGMQSVSGNSSIASIASHGGNNIFFDGKIDEVRVYNRALSAAEVKLQYLAEK